MATVTAGGSSVGAIETVLLVGEGVLFPFMYGVGWTISSSSTLEATEADKRGRLASGLFCSLVVTE